MINLGVFRQFVPTSSLSPSDRAELARHTQELKLRPGQVLFNRGDSARTLAYLTAGELELVNESGIRRLRAGTEDARHPVCSGGVRTVTATCMAPSEVLLVDLEKLDLLMTWAQTGTVEVRDMGGDDDDDAGDWMAAMLRSPALQSVPPANIARIISSVEPLSFNPGGVIIREGDPGDAYYVITGGQCEVVRRDPNTSLEARLNVLGVGIGFGEEALVTGQPRNATVRALTEASVVRLSAADFHRLLQEPLIRKTDLASITGNSLLVDVRLPEEYARGHLPGAVNVPLRDLRQMTAQLQAARRPLVVYCDSGRRSASATFLLTERGVDVTLVEGGVPESQLVETTSNPLPV